MSASGWRKSTVTSYKGYEQLFAAAGTLQARTEGAKRAAVICTVLESDLAARRRTGDDRRLFSACNDETRFHRA